MLRNCLLVVGLVLLMGGWAAADIIGPGVNFMKTQPESTWSVESGKLPSDFFEPGSEPFEGQIVMFTYTNVWHGASEPIADGLWTVPTEIVAMTLHSVEPIEVMVTDPDTGAQDTKLYDVLVTPDPSTPSTGLYRVTRDPLNGGPGHGLILANGDEPLPPEFPAESFFDVFFDFEFTARDPHGGDPGHIQLTDRLILTADVPWDSMASPLYYDPAAGDFFPGFGQPPDPIMPQTLVFQGEHFTWHLRLEPIPEPATLSLLALGGLALLRRRRA